MALRDLFGKRSGSSPSTAPPAATSQATNSSTIPYGVTELRVVGTSHHQDHLLRVAGGRSENGVQLRDFVQLIPEPSNPVDPAAVAVYLRGKPTGYLSAEDARTYRSMIDEAISTSGAATCWCEIRGGWDRGGGDVGHFGVSIQLHDPVRAIPLPAPDEERLPRGGAVSISSEEYYQSALLDATHGRSVETRTLPVIVELVPAIGNPHVKRSTGPVLEVRLRGQAVGFLTSAMSERFMPVIEQARSAGRTVTCEAELYAGTKGGEEIIEVRLQVEQPERS